MTALAQFLAALVWGFAFTFALAGLVLLVAIVTVGVRDRLKKRSTDNLVARAMASFEADVDRILAGRDERAASRELYSTRRRDVLGVPKEAPAALDMPGRVTHRSDDEHHGF